MLKKIIFINICFLYCLSCKAQSNQVLNPSFEVHVDTSLAGVAGFAFDFVTDWTGLGTADYFLSNSYGNITTPPNTHFGFEYPHSGSAFGGFVFITPPDITENVQASFRNPLIAGRTYGLECYVSIAEYYEGCASDFGFYFSDTQVYISSVGLLPFEPQFENPPSNMLTVRDGWQRISGSYTAHGGERFLCLGNFTTYDSCHKSNCGFPGPDIGLYLLLDDVAVYDTAIIDTIRLCMNDSAEIGGQWYKPSSSIISETIGSALVRHYIEQRSNSVSYTEINVSYSRTDTVQIGERWICYSDSIQRPYYFCDSFDTIGSCLHEIYLWPTTDTFVDAHYQNIYGCDSTVRYICRTNVGIDEIKNSEITWSVYPNPANDFIQIKVSANDPDKYLVKIMDIAGRSLLSQALDNPQIEITNLKSGIYFVSLYNAKTGKLVGNKKFVKE